MAKIFDCANCTDQDKVEKGCNKELEKILTTMPCVCGGYSGCDLCNGTDRIEFKSCPRKHALKISYLMPYFFCWKQSNCIAYPDGGGRLYQPQKMLDAFGIANIIINDKEREELESLKRKSENGRRNKI